MSILDELLEFKDKELSSIPVAEDFSKTIYSKLRPEDRIVNSEEAGITSVETAREYIELLREFRKWASRSSVFYGQHAGAFFERSVSETIYPAKRFLLELIQNIEDCDFGGAAPKLTISFYLKENKIVLKYNEVGFTPFNVFAVTGIAEKSKNINPDDNHIGEKGIGFKSVFGIADEVRIRSGWYSFTMKKGEMVVPNPDYDNFDPEKLKGRTELTLYVSGQGKAGELYKEITDLYSGDDAFFSRNPLLFLEKLTSLKFYKYDEDNIDDVDEWDETGEIFKKPDMEFDISRPKATSESKPVAGGKLTINNGDKQINCYLYSKVYWFTAGAYNERYKQEIEDGLLTKQNKPKEMKLIAVVPLPKHLENKEITRGAFYSFFPTQVGLTVPIALHVPFKLEDSREYIDPQGNNKWFCEACNHLSEFMGYVYENIKYTDTDDRVSDNIIRYVPSDEESLFAESKGNNILREDDRFKGGSYLTLPVFPGVGRDEKRKYVPENEIFFFKTIKNEKNKKHNIFEPIRAYKLLKHPKRLYLSPCDISEKYTQIECVDDVYFELLKKALDYITPEDETNEILDYLDDVPDYSGDENAAGYSYDKLDKAKPDKLKFSCVETILRHERLSEKLKGLCDEAIRNKSLYGIRVIDASDNLFITDVIKGKFEKSDLPLAVQDYMERGGKNYIFVKKPGKNVRDIVLAFDNTIVIYADDPLEGFLGFCDEFHVPQEDDFRFKYELHKCAGDIEKNYKDEVEYLEVVKKFRNETIDAFNRLGYDFNIYIKLIMNSATKRDKRFLSELLQNADDCKYTKTAKAPYFRLVLDEQAHIVTTEYNEDGFTNENVRAITALGESNKKIIFGDNQVGEKGVGFKSIFAIASKVNIHSGKLHFSLSKDKPIIPQTDGLENLDVTPGTKMEIFLQNGESFPNFESNRNFLELCLCLSKLRTVEFLGHKLEINDGDDNDRRTVSENDPDFKKIIEDKRTISIGTEKYSFRRFVFSFDVADDQAFEERKKTRYNITRDQEIVCFFSGNETGFDKKLYHRLPTNHLINIPLAIDAPFSLVTSREFVDENSLWNDYILNKVYAAILKVIDQLKYKERSKIFKYFCKLGNVPDGNNIEVFAANDYLNGYDYIGALRKMEILPTYDKNTFAKPGNAFLYPKFVHILFMEHREEELAKIVNFSTVIDYYNDNAESDEYKAMRMLECAYVPFEPVLSRIIEKEIFLRDKVLREKGYLTALYEYLIVHKSEGITNFKIIPVYSKEGDGETVYISFNDDIKEKIFTHPTEKRSTENCFVLVEEYMPPEVFRDLFGREVTQWGVDDECRAYNGELEKKLRSSASSDEEKYEYLSEEFGKGNLHKNKSYNTLIKLCGENLVPLKNEYGEIINANYLFIGRGPDYYDGVAMIQKLTVHPECAGLFDFLFQMETEREAHNLRNIYFADFKNINYDEPLTEDDVEALLEETEPGICYFKNYKEILHGFYEQNRLSEELIEAYNISIYNGGFDKAKAYHFPIHPVKGSDDEFRSAVGELCRQPDKTVKVLRFASRVEKNKDRHERFNVEKHYAPPGADHLCFCQMCGGVFSKTIATNLIWNPEIQFPELYISLCYGCFDYFNSLKRKKNEREAYLNAIQAEKYPVQDNGNPVKVIIDEYPGVSLTFTPMHLYTIKEIIRQKPEVLLEYKGEEVQIDVLKELIGKMKKSQALYQLPLTQEQLEVLEKLADDPKTDQTDTIPDDDMNEIDGTGSTDDTE